MRKSIAIGLLTAAAMLPLSPAQAYEGPWCAYMIDGRDSYTGRCDLPNYEACRAEIAATGGTWCTQNPRYRGPAEMPVRAGKKKKRPAG